MKSTRIILAMLLFLQIPAHGQKIFTLQSGSDASFFSTIDSAISHAVDGDVLYLPGGVFTVNTLIINKGVLIIGAGHYPDSSVATSTTNLSGNIQLLTGASGGGITGCYISGNVTVGNSTSGSDSVSNFSITRCSFNNISLSPTGLAPTYARIFSVSENVIRGSVFGANAVNISFTKNIICGSVNNFNGTATFLNNDFIGLGNCTTMLTFINDVSSSTFENNIMLFTSPVCPGGAYLSGASDNNVFSHNLLAMPLTFPLGTNTGYSNITNQPVPTIFMSAAGDVFNYSDNYGLQTLSPGNDAGTDLRDVGIYGTVEPYKDGAIPFNPHIVSKTISGTTNTQGQLNIQIEVSAQDR